MKTIQIILILLIAVFTLAFLLRIKGYNFIKALLIVGSLIGIYFVLFPSVTTTMGKEVGVGRGTDLLLYIFMIAVFFTLIGFYIQIRKLREQVTILIRELAIKEATQLGQDSKST